MSTQTASTIGPAGSAVRIWRRFPVVLRTIVVGWVILTVGQIPPSILLLGHAYATLAFFPFFISYSVLQGLLVFLTRSILPSVVLHVAGDFLILPIQYGVMESPLGTSPWAHAAVVAAFGIAAVPAFFRLAAVAQTSATIGQPPMGVPKT